MVDLIFDFGDRIRDKITGFEGIVAAKSEYFNGCKRYGVQGLKLKEDGTVTELEWFDAQQVELLKARAVSLDVPKKAPGGPMPVPPK